MSLLLTLPPVQHAKLDIISPKMGAVPHARLDVQNALPLVANVLVVAQDFTLSTSHARVSRPAKHQ